MKILYLHKNKLYVDYIQIIPKIHLESTKMLIRTIFTIKRNNRLSFCFSIFLNDIWIYFIYFSSLFLFSKTWRIHISIFNTLDLHIE